MVKSQKNKSPPANVDGEQSNGKKTKLSNDAAVGLAGAPSPPSQPRVSTPPPQPPTIGVSINASPSSKAHNMSTNQVLVANSASPHVRFIWIMKSGSGRAGWFNTIKQRFNDDPETYGPIIHGTVILPRRDHMNHEANDVLWSQQYVWFQQVLVTPNTRMPVSELGEAVAKAYSKIENEHGTGKFKTNYVFAQDETRDPPLPVNYYVLDKDAILLLKKVYSSPSITKAALVGDRHIMKMFFGSQEEGESVLSTLTEEEWHNTTA